MPRPQTKTPWQMDRDADDEAKRQRTRDNEAERLKAEAVVTAAQEDVVAWTAEVGHAK